jgi:hypothetical protein
MTNSTAFLPLQLPLYKWRTYFFALIFITGNLLLPQITHLIPRGGLIFLPIYFFTLIASYKFGLKVGLLTAILSPLLNHFLFGMPPAFVLPAILVKSTLLAIIASFVASKFQKISVIYLLVVVLAYQLPGSMVEWAITKSFETAMQDFKIGIPGMLIQIFGGWIILKSMAKYA